MINKESQRRKIEGSNKESRTQARKIERESRGLTCKERQRRRIESRRQGN